DVDAEVIRRRQADDLVLGQAHEAAELLDRVEPVAQLPAPVIPFFPRHILPRGGWVSHMLLRCDHGVVHRESVLLNIWATAIGAAHHTMSALLANKVTPHNKAAFPTSRAPK